MLALTPKLTDLNGKCVLTPAQFLIGDVLITPSDYCNANSNISYFCTWKDMKNMYQDSKKHGLATPSYPYNLEKNANLQPNDAMLLKDEIQPASF
ncbi:hypothetical protein AVEN_162957-1 [Araneus ventricosus]|uniref:Uncharacterized protein n=1 Tax=Araneus ventricosus TaxID=182803 RepID=A0A4Y2C157_ARAVE|nr:hypothetical protein AVEN_162957-1 [Araneus ventricosus]